MDVWRRSEDTVGPRLNVSYACANGCANREWGLKCRERTPSTADPLTLADSGSSNTTQIQRQATEGLIKQKDIM